MAKIKKLASGLTVITVPIKGIKTATVMALVGAGSRLESDELRGASHFLEHMVFKGTKKYPEAKEVSEVLDRVGGEYNAFTGKEYTGYYAKVNAEHLDLAVNWTAEVVANALVEAKKMRRERGVIIEEMNMYEDTPMQHIGDIFEELAFGDQPLGRDIIGTRETIKKMSRNQLFNYMQRYYVQENCVVCVSGNLGAKTLKSVEQAFSRMRKGVKTKAKKAFLGQQKPQLKIQKKKTDQSHCMAGFLTEGLFSKERYVLGLINTILGSGMSSRLFLEIREKRGLAYYVTSESQLYTDTGYLAVLAGVENNKFVKALEVVLKEFTKLKMTLVAEDELKKAKEYIKGQTMISMEASNARAHYWGAQQLLKGKVETPEERFRKIEAVTEKDIQRVARKFFVPERLNVAVIGPQKETKELKKIIKSFA